MKKMPKMPKVKINISEFFSKNIGILGLVVVIILFSVYMVVQKMNNMDARILDLENNKPRVSQPAMETEDSEDMVKGDSDVSLDENAPVDEFVEVDAQ